MRILFLFIAAYIASTNAIAIENPNLLSTSQESPPDIAENDDSPPPESNNNPDSSTTTDNETPLNQLVADTVSPPTSNCGGPANTKQKSEDTLIANGNGVCPSSGDENPPGTFGEHSGSVGTKTQTHREEMCPPLLQPVCCFGIIRPMGVSITMCVLYDYLAKRICRSMKYIFCCHDYVPYATEFGEGDTCTGVYGVALLNTRDQQIYGNP